MRTRTASTGTPGPKADYRGQPLAPGTTHQLLLGRSIVSAVLVPGRGETMPSMVRADRGRCRASDDGSKRATEVACRLVAGARFTRPMPITALGQERSASPISKRSVRGTVHAGASWKALSVPEVDASCYSKLMLVNFKVSSQIAPWFAICPHRAGSQRDPNKLIDSRLASTIAGLANSTMRTTWLPSTSRQRTTFCSTEVPSNGEIPAAVYCAK